MTDHPATGAPITTASDRYGHPAAPTMFAGPGNGLPTGAYAAALAALPGMGPVTLARLLLDADPIETWAAVRAGEVRRPARRGHPPTVPRLDLDAAGLPPSRSQSRPSWAEVARSCDVAELWASCRRGGIGVTWLGGPDYPLALSTDPEPPGVLFWRGRLDCLERPCVAVVGTRRATPDGRAMAFELGRDLAGAGVCVVSGLALGIDGAAHTGALDASLDPGSAGPVGVAASGVDRPYPPRHSGLWERVVASGAVLSETPPGRPAQSWRFPARNRIIAGLVSMVVVVESHTTGGSLITADAAISRGIDVRAVPGSVHSPASAGSNQLLYDGPSIVRHAGDVLDGIGMCRPWPPPRPPAQPSSPPAVPASAACSGSGGDRLVRPEPTPGAALDPDLRRVLDAVSWRPTSLGQVLERTRAEVGSVARILDQLEQLGRITAGSGWWSRRG